MLKGTTIAIRVGTALRQVAIEQKCSADLVIDLQGAIDRLIVHTLQAPDNHATREQAQLIANEIVETFAVMMTTRGYDAAAREMAVHGQAE